MLEYKGYLGQVEYDSDAKILAGRVIGLRDVVTFQAKNAKDVEAEFRASIDEYLAFCKEKGKAPDKAFSGQFVVRTSPELHRKTAMAAQAAGKSLNAFVSDRLANGSTRNR